MQIEQAVFTSAKTDRAQGYQLLSRSPELAEADARELSVWGPSHGSLLAEQAKSASTNYCRLASGAHCVSRTVMAGAEYSGRGETVYTQFLIMPPEAMARFANNPFAIVRAALANGTLCVMDPVPDSLPPVSLAGHAPAVDLGLIAQLARDPGPAAMATLVQTALASDRLAMLAETACEQLVAGLINLLPVECRPNFSFCTGLKSSPSRPVRICGVNDEESEWRALARRGVTLLRLERNMPGDAVSSDGWAAWIAAVLEAGKLSLLAAELEQPRPGLTCGDLAELGNQLLASLKSARTTQSEPIGTSTSQPVPTVATHRATSLRSRADTAHPAHQAEALVETPVRMSCLDQLSNRLAEQPAEILELLEHIDDLVFSAISGDARALAELEVLWPIAMIDLDPELVEQSREQYLRCALSICSDFAEAGTQRPERAVSAIDVLCVLFEE